MDSMLLPRPHELQTIRRIEINGKVYEYLLTSSVSVLRDALSGLGCRLPSQGDYHLNLYLSDTVRKAMEETCSVWSLTVSNNAGILNYYNPGCNGGAPYAVLLKDLFSPSKMPETDFFDSIIRQLESFNKSTEKLLRRNWTPLMLAVAREKHEIVRILLENGAPPDRPDEEGITPLMLASLLNNTRIIELLVSYGADVNLRSKNGLCALIYAIYSESPEAIQILERHGANLNITLDPKIDDEKATFLEALNFYISCFTLKGKGDPSLIYKKCGMTKQTFSKIRASTKSYHPKKDTALQLAIGLRLTVFQAEDLLSRAGYFLDENSAVDRIIKTHLSHLDFDIMRINDEIYKETGEPFLKE